MQMYLDFREMSGSGVPFLVCFLTVWRQIARKIGQGGPSIAYLKDLQTFPAKIPAQKHRDQRLKSRRKYAVFKN